MKKNSWDKNKHDIIETQFKSLIKFIIKSEIEFRKQALFNEWTDIFMLQFRKSVDHRGFESTLGYYKDVRLCVTRFLSGRPLLDTKFSQNIGLYRDGLPKRVGLVSCLIHQQDPNDLRVILTVLNYGRMFILSAKENPSIRSIVSPDCGYWTRTLDFQKFVRKWLKGKTRHYPSHCDSHRDPIYVGYGSGANGRPSLYASLWEARHIPSRYLTLFKQHSPNWEDDDLKITRDFVQKFTRLEKSDLFPYMFKIKTSKVKGKTKREQVPYDNEDNVFNWAKLSRLPDKEGKTRVVCIFNYWAQKWLKTIHEPCLKYLKQCPWDCTFDHSQFKLKLKRESNNNFHSIDLKDATDRFPRYLQEIVVEELFGKDIATAWDHFMSQPVRTWQKGHHTITYGTGQPMGAYSSWPIFALTHGLVLEYLRTKTGSPKQSFIVLGDDVAISSDILAQAYNEFLAETKVPVSKVKTMDSCSTFEFAKRWIHNGVEISPFPVASFIEAKHDYSSLWEAVRVARDKGWFKRSTKGGPGLVADILAALKVPKAYADRLLHKYEVYQSFHLNISDIDQNHWQRKVFLESLNLSSCTNYRDQGRYFNEILKHVIGDDIEWLIEQYTDEFQHLFKEWLDSGIFPRSEEDDFSLDSNQIPLPKSIPPLKVFISMQENISRISSETLDDTEDILNDIVAWLADVKITSLNGLAGRSQHYKLIKVRSLLMNEAIKRFKEEHFGL